MSNSFSALGHIYIPGFYTGRTLLKKNFNRQDCISVVPKHFCLPAQKTSWSNFAVHQPRHYLEVTTSPGNDLRKSCDVVQNGADLQKKRWVWREKGELPMLEQLQKWWKTGIFDCRRDSPSLCSPTFTTTWGWSSQKKGHRPLITVAKDILPDILGISCMYPCLGIFDANQANF